MRPNREGGGRRGGRLLGKFVRIHLGLGWRAGIIYIAANDIFFPSLFPFPSEGAVGDGGKEINV